MCRICILKKEWWKEMGAGPIEDSVTATLKTGDAGPKPVNEPGSELYFGTENASAVPPNVARAQAGLPPAPNSPVEDLIEAMHIFIEEQNAMIHHGDVGRFATAQEAYIRATNKYIGAMLSK